MVEGLLTIESKRGFAETLAGYEAGLAARGITVFARIDHAAGARSAGLELRPTTALIFGNPKTGTGFMQAAQSAGIDLPLKALISEPENGMISISHNDPPWVARRHGIGPELEPAIHGMQQLLAALAKEAAGL
jgi:uncharacterized protein (DUF302 family)